MAKIQLSRLLETIRGRIGRTVFRVRPDGTIILSGTPRYKKGKGSPKQKAYRKHVREHVIPMAKDLAKIHPIYAELAAQAKAKEKWLSAYNFAFADCVIPPVIHRVERAEGCIRVQATDNIWVDTVYVSILDEAGKVLQQGLATRGADDWWEFPTQIAGKTIVAEARDLAWNNTKFVL